MGPSGSVALHGGVCGASRGVAARREHSLRARRPWDGRAGKVGRPRGRICRCARADEDEVVSAARESVRPPDAGAGFPAEGAERVAVPAEVPADVAQVVGERVKSTYESLSTTWDSIPTRYQIVIAMALAFVVCNMDKVNISIAIIPMASQFGWTPATVGFIQSAFFYGYLLAQLPGGYLANKFGGQRVLPFGVLLWSFATAIVPPIAGNVEALSLSRVAVGLGEGLSPPAATDVIARYVPLSERSRATSLVFGGLNAGSVLGLVLAPHLIDLVGWPAVFILFGVIGGLWCAWFFAVIPSNAAMADAEAGAAGEITEGGGTIAKREGEGEGESASIPWRQFITHKPFQAMAFVHFCNNWATYTILSWLPTFYKQTLDVDLQGAANLALLPPVASVLVSAVAAPLADYLVGTERVSVTVVRKTMQTVAFACPAACMLTCIFIEDKHSSTWLLGLGIGLQSFSLAGLYSNFADLSRQYASILLSMSNVFGSLAGILGVNITGYLLDETGSWNLSLFVPCLLFYFLGTCVYLKYGSGEPIEIKEEG